MVLSDKSINEYLASGKIIIEPAVTPNDVRPVGIRLHLGEGLLLPKSGQTVDLSKEQPVDYDSITMGTDGFVLKPSGFILGTTLELIKVPRNIVCFLDGRSTLARLGLMIHVTAMVADGNFEEPGSIVLEIKNLSPMNLILKPNLPIGMLLFNQIDQEIAQDVQFQYKGQKGVLPPDLKNQFK
ncbi:MAG: dCTP deaminase [Candidatus Doudnabacteria bacterium]|nr:dCTP deaminase [Candidatus Doudnabacteria bacterium]